MQKPRTRTSIRSTKTNWEAFFLATLKELQTVVLAATHEFCKLWQISRAIKKLGFRLRFTTRKIIGERNEAQRRAWFTNTLTESPHGIFCVPVEVLLDLDEMGCTLLDTARRRGHSLPGQPVRTHHEHSTHHYSMKVTFWPVASPDLAWIELCFAEVKRRLRESPGQITEQNLAQHIYKAAFAIDGPLVQKFASACHYYVPGLPYTPYTNPL
ncbi:hypothetical protein Pelo_6454 [Pelomyxa schiedti]|nr:hypothetical protein Pelo_6454 [Pelomyxa schiedti]